MLDKKHDMACRYQTTRMRYDKYDIYNRLRYDAIDKDYHNARKVTKRNEDKEYNRHYIKEHAEDKGHAQQMRWTMVSWERHETVT